MAEIYIRDDLIPRQSYGDVARRSQDDINNILTSIIPRPTTSMCQVRLGYTAPYSNDSDANFFFRPEILTKLKDQNLTACLSHNTQDQREIYIIK